MAINPVSQAGFQGFQASVARAQDAAERIAGQALPGTPPAPANPAVVQPPPAAEPSGPTDLPGALVELRAADLQARAAARAIEAGEESLGKLIDIRA